MVVINTDSKFDIQLSESEVHVSVLARLLSDTDLKVEVKTEKWQWAQTGNLCIEYRCRGKWSGIATTEADYWAHEVCTDSGDTICWMLFPMPMLKRICHILHERGKIKRNSGDDGQSDVILLKLSDLIRVSAS